MRALAAVRPMSLSIVIPTLNEAVCIAEVVARTRGLGDVEIVVVDGGSTDGTAERAAAAGADVVLESPRGRARQQNAGARAASGETLLFLHADCRLGDDAAKAVHKALRRPDVVGGCFRQRIDADGRLYRWLERGNDLRAARWKWIYGDQGLFVRRAVFERLGGFPDVRLMEDLLFAKRLRRAGRMVLLDTPIHVSARRWQRAGIVPQTLRNWTLLALAHCGVSPNHLARFYPNVR